MNINKEVHLFLQKLPNLEGKKIAVGYSAGADSTALLHILSQKAKHFNFTLEAVFFSHNGSPINDGEDKNLNLAKILCEKMSINLIDVSIDMQKSAKKSWEQLGREGRLSFYKKSQYDYVFLGHHQDDQNETTMMQLLRGGGRGSSAMKEIDGIFCRPMLKVPKEEIYSYLKEKNIPWIEDPTNVNVEFARNWWRNEGLPKIKEHYPNYGDLLENFREKNTALNQIAFDMAKMDGLDDFLKGKSISIKNLPDYRVSNLLSYAFSSIGKYIETNKIDNWLKIGKATKTSEIVAGDYMFTYKDNNIGLINIKKENTNQMPKKIKP